MVLILIRMQFNLILIRMHIHGLSHWPVASSTHDSVRQSTATVVTIFASSTHDSGLLAFVYEKNIHLICDEIYSGSVFSAPKFTSIAEILATDKISQTERVHIVYSLSKDLGLPGFRVGVIPSFYCEAIETLVCNWCVYATDILILPSHGL
jgi:hypothetical protein